MLRKMRNTIYQPLFPSRQRDDDENISGKNDTPLRSPSPQKVEWSSTWALEILFIICSGLLLGFTALILGWYNHKPVPKFVDGITLNTIVSILITISKTLLLAAMASAIGQLKWQWFEHAEGRRALDIQLFDAASRGPLGSAIFLTTGHVWSLASVGAVVSILTLAFDPFAQELLRYQLERSAPTNLTSQASNVSRAEDFVAGDDPSIILEVQRRIMSAFWVLTNETQDFAQPQCLTGHCVWEEFESLAMCSTCESRKEGIELSDTSFSWNATYSQRVLEDLNGPGPKGDFSSVTKGVSISFPTDFPCAADKSSIEGTVASSQFRHDFYAIEVVYPTYLFEAMFPLEDYTYETASSNPTAAKTRIGLSLFSEGEFPQLSLLDICQVDFEKDNGTDTPNLSIREVTLCRLTPCVKKYSFSISNGIPYLKTTGTRYGSWFFNITGLELIDGALYNASTGEAFEQAVTLSWGDTPGNDEMVLDLDNTPSLSSIRYRIGTASLYPFLNSHVLYRGEIDAADSYADDKRNIVSNDTGIHFRPYFLQGTNLAASRVNPQTSSFQQIAAQGGLRNVIPKVAAQLSKYFREKANIAVPGVSYTLQSVVEVRWYWIAFPIGVWTLGVVFLTISIWTCRGEDQVLWKTSSLPLLYHGFRVSDFEDICTAGDEVESINGMEKLSKTLQMELKKDSYDGRRAFKRMRDSGSMSTEQP
ncbi:hypothetical protein SAMD00023353_0602720 [Rosellinia necatrix]|uniref:Uncharacterized protein n=1 Tax=Rosellinia necatrix TaxID=77044 RepID=A0A1S7UKY4_ROSNE|nr:hypothetical protein SAMD00023353_0602720 [Rosellinia necatrix]